MGRGTRAAFRLERIPIGDQFDGFEVYAVGGPVRSALRGETPEDIDVLAVPKPEEIDEPVESLRDRMTIIDPDSTIPVFKTQMGGLPDGADKYVEVALPRTEESTGEGFHDFNMHVVPPDTPVDEAVQIDLQRRDLTVNAMAFDLRDGELVDPYNGQEALTDDRLRHVDTEAFGEDPLRVVRAARFAPRLGADIHPETVELARDIAPKLDETDENGDELVPTERITDEFRKVIKQADTPGGFFNQLDHMDALDTTFPTIAALDSDQFDQAVTALNDGATQTPNNIRVPLAALGSALGEANAQSFATEQDITNDEKKVLMFGARGLGDKTATADTLSANELLTVADHFATDPEHPGLSVDEAMRVAQATTDRDTEDIEEAQRHLEKALTVINTVDGATVIDEEGIDPEDIGPDGPIKGEEFGELLHQYRSNRLKSLL